MNEFDLQLTDPNFFAGGDPYALWKRLRAADPVHWTEGNLSTGFWLLTRYADVLAVYTDPVTFSSERNGMVLPSSRELEQVSARDLGAGEMMIMIDPPRHGGMRRAFNRLFLPRAIAELESSGRDLVRDILEPLLRRGHCDMVTEIAVKLPMAFICQIMGIPREQWPTMFEWAAMIIGAEDPEYQRGASALDTQRTGNLGIRQYCLDTSLERRGGSGRDLLSVIGKSNVWGRALTDSEVGQNGLMFVVAGLETTRNAISGGTLALIENPEQLRRLRSDRSLMRPAVEEILRWTTPLVQAMRTATKDVELGGKQIREGDRVVMCHAAANRDEAAFADPDRFDVGRTPNEHLAFGRGAHYCLGAHLARLEIRLMLEAILDLAPALELAGEVERLRSVIFAGIKHMPVRFSPRHQAAA